MESFTTKTKKFNSIVRDRILCPNCGHSVLFSRKDKAICSWCKHYVFKDKKTEFEYRLKESINKQK